MYCKNCGAKISDNSSFCSSCGTNLNDSAVSFKNKEPEKHKNNSKKLLIGILASFTAFIVIAVSVILLLPKGPDSSMLSETLQQETISLTDTYYDAQILTYKVLNVDNTQIDYDTWYRGMEKACSLWQQLDEQCTKLDLICNDVIENTSSGTQNNTFQDAVGSLFTLREANAYTRNEINAVFDAAPAGQRIKALANFLGTDAKTAYSVLKNTQSEITKEAYEQESFYEKCETAATVIKDAAKVGFMASTIAYQGGFAATYSLLEGAGIIAAGTDLFLEIYEDGATIAYGEGNDYAAVVKDLRKGSKPLAAIFGLSNLTGNAIEQLGYLSDSTLALFQNDEVLGFNIKNKNLSNEELYGMDYADLQYWANANGIDLQIAPNGFPKLTADDVADVDIDVPGASTEPSAIVSPEVSDDVIAGDLNQILIGVWQGTDYWGDGYGDDGRYISYHVDNQGEISYLTFTESTASFQYVREDTGENDGMPTVFQYTLDGNTINLYSDGTLQFCVYYNPSDGNIYNTDPVYLTTNGTYRLYAKISS